MVKYFRLNRHTHLKVSLRVLGCATVLALTVSAVGENSAHAALDLGLDSTNYLGKGSPTREDNYSNFDAGYSGAIHGPVLEAQSQGQIMFSLNQSSYHFIEVPEAYFGTAPEISAAQVSMGRRLEHWNHLDEDWGLGIWQPRFRWDYLQPQQVGLTGTFLSLNLHGLHLVGFVSPLFVPDQSAPLDVASGRVISKSPWATSPPSSVPLFGQSTDIRYSAVIPSVASIVTQTSLSLMGRLGADETEHGVWGSVAYAYKPMNQLLTSYEAYYNINDGTIDATVYPHVEYHQVVSLESGFTGKRLSGWFSVLADRPSLQPQVATLTSQELSSSIAFGPSATYDLLGDHLVSPGTATTTDFSFIRQYGGDAPDSGRLATGTNHFESRYPFKATAKTGIKTPLSPLIGSAGRTTFVSTHLLYDLDNPGSIFSTVLMFKPERTFKNCTFTLGTDILTSQSDKPSDPGNPDFISRYRANDRVYGGFSYAF